MCLVRSSALGNEFKVMLPLGSLSPWISALGIARGGSQQRRLEALRLTATAENQEAGVLALREGEGGAHARLAAEAVGQVMVTGTGAILRAG
jgi:hypothetical protein